MTIQQLNQQLQEIHKEKKLVFGSGDLLSPIMLVGEAPGKNEVLIGRPFVGAAGKQLDYFLERADIDRRHLYITNVIKYRLSKINIKTNNEINRPVTIKEIMNEREYLLKEIEILNPGLIVTMGNTALVGVTGSRKFSVGEVHGTVLNIKIDKREYMIFPIYHPASLIYNRNLAVAYEEDLFKLKTIIKNFYRF